MCEAQETRKHRILFWIALVGLSYAFAQLCLAGEPTPLHSERHGAIIRANTSTKKLALLFTGDERAESAVPILDTLKQRAIKASFFVTGNFLRDPAHAPLVQRIIAEGHYLGPHSDSHPLYCDWDDREKSLVTKKFFIADLKKNIADLRVFGALVPNEDIYFIPPYEWYNRDQAAWCDQLSLRERAGARENNLSHRERSRRAPTRSGGRERVRETDQKTPESETKPASPTPPRIVLINFTPGSGSNRDYAPEGDARFVPSQKIHDDILAYEQKDPHGLNGFLLLLHLGSGRRDPFHAKLGALCDELQRRAYTFARVDKLLEDFPKARQRGDHAENQNNPVGSTENGSD